jgi:FtsH-binding integral membrane protein
MYVCKTKTMPAPNIPKSPAALVLTLAVAALALAFATARSSFGPDGKPTCDRRVLNTYLYVLTSATTLALLAFALLPLVATASWGWFLAAAAVDLVAALLVLLLPARQVALKHAALGVLLLASGFLYAGLVAVTAAPVLLTALLVTLLLFGLLTFVAYRFEHLLLASHGRVLSYAVIAAVLLYIVASFFAPPDSGIMLWIAGAVVVLVTASMAYRAKEIKQKECAPETAPPDYPRDALGVLIDLRVVFNLLTQILSGRRGRGIRGR